MNVEQCPARPPSALSVLPPFQAGLQGWLRPAYYPIINSYQDILMKISSEVTTPAENNVKMVSVALGTSIAGLALLVLMTLVAYFMDYSEEWVNVIDIVMMGVWCLIFLLFTISLPMSIAGMISSTRRLKAFFAFLISCMTLALFLLAVTLNEMIQGVDNFTP